MKKILFIMDTMVSGGSQKVLLNYLNVFSKEFDVTLLLLNNYGVYVDSIPSNIRVIKILDYHKQIPLNKCSDFSFFNVIKILFFKSLFRGEIYLKYLSICANFLLKKHKFDYVIGFQEGPANYVASRLRIDAKKCVWLHSDISKLNISQSKMENGVYENIDKVVCVSQSVKNAALKKYDYLDGKVVVLYNAIDIEDIINKSECKSDIILNDKKLQLVTVGRLSEEKNLIILIQSLENLLKNDNNIHLNIIGEGSQRKALESYIVEKKLTKYVTLHGFLYNPYPMMRASHIYISASLYEGLPTVLIEAAILGLNVIANDIPANREVIEEYNKGCLLDINNKQYLEEVILSFKNSDDFLDCNSDDFLIKLSNEKLINNFNNLMNY